MCVVVSNESERMIDPFRVIRKKHKTKITTTTTPPQNYILF